MNKIITLAVLFTLLSIKAFGQNYYTISFEGMGQNENDPYTHRMYLDTTSNADNIWQIGIPEKNLFTSAFTQPNVIATDLLNPYPVNDTSSFIIEHYADFGFAPPYNNEVLFGGYYYVNSDTITDFGKIEFSPDNGDSWIDLQDPAYSNEIEWSTEYVTPVLTGNSNGWRKFQAEMTQLGPLFDIHLGDTVLYRFSFMSDGIQTNKDGLMFDSIFVWDVPPLGLQTVGNELNISIYPNPSVTAINVGLNEGFTEISKLVINDQLGRTIKEVLISTNEESITIDISDLPQGMYSINLTNKTGDLLSSGSVLKTD